MKKYNISIAFCILLTIFMGGSFAVTNTISYQCDAPLCKTKTQINIHDHVNGMFASLFYGGDFAYFEFCGEHKERITAGRFDDRDPETNPDLERFRK